MSTARTARRRTLWEEGRQPGRLVTRVAALLALALVALDLGVTDGLGWIFDLGFVAVCVAAALLVRPHDFFGVGVLPPLLMAVVVAALAGVDRAAVADPRDGLVQAVVSGLAHHAGALVVGYGLTLAVLALRQVALRNAGALRSAVARPEPRRTAGPARRPVARTTARTARPAGAAPRIPAQAAPADHPRRSAAGGR